METTPGLERFSLSGRVVLVTGAPRGLGLEVNNAAVRGLSVAL
jgi:NAD(P)-dependent dehydrogenase (short-subunit alcohol dehydrogenase family)